MKKERPEKQKRTARRNWR